MSNNWPPELQAEHDALRKALDEAKVLTTRFNDLCNRQEVLGSVLTSKLGAICEEVEYTSQDQPLSEGYHVLEQQTDVLHVVFQEAHDDMMEASRLRAYHYETAVKPALAIWKESRRKAGL